jgi:hypothetical protein
MDIKTEICKCCEAGKHPDKRHTNTHTHNIHTHTHIHLHTYTQHKHTHAYTYTHRHTQTHTHIHTQAHSHIHTFTHTRARVRVVAKIDILCTVYLCVGCVKILKSFFGLFACLHVCVSACLCVYFCVSVSASCACMMYVLCVCMCAVLCGCLQDPPSPEASRGNYGRHIAIFSTLVHNLYNFHHHHRLYNQPLPRPQFSLLSTLRFPSTSLPLAYPTDQTPLK